MQTVAGAAFSHVRQVSGRTMWSESTRPVEGGADPKQGWNRRGGQCLRAQMVQPGQAFRVLLGEDASCDSARWPSSCG